MKCAASHASRTDVYEEITNRIILALESGVTPWKKNWDAAYEAPRNYRSKHVYQGINAVMLSLLKYESLYFLTFNQARELGGCVRKGEEGLPIVFFKVDKKQDAKGQEKSIAILRKSTVFNISQIDGIEWKLPKLPSRNHSPQEAAEQILAGYVDGPSIQHGGSRPHYRESTDTVTMPEASNFHTAEAYYSTLFHELAHSTGHSKRLNRATLTKYAFSGREACAKEELVAELSAAFLGSAAGLDMSITLPSSASYIDTWLRVLRNDKQLLISAASQGQKAANYILGITPGCEANEAVEPT